MLRTENDQADDIDTGNQEERNDRFDECGDQCGVAKYSCDVAHCAQKMRRVEHR